MLLTLALACALSVCALAEYPVTLTDQAGREVTIENKPEHIVSGYYISTSACIALGLSDRMAAVEAKADTRNIYALSAPELISLPNVGTAKNFNLEACLAAEPDVVILPKRLSEAAESISAFDIPVLLVNPEDDELLAQMLLLIGAATETEDRATDLNAFILTQLGMCQEMLKNETPVTALILGNSDKLTCAPNGMYQASLLKNACAVNAAADIEGTKWAEISYEQLLAMNPQAIIIPAEAVYTAEDVLGDAELAELDAVKNGAVYQMPKAFEAWDSPVPSGVLGVLWTAKTLHPQTYGEAQYKDAAKMLYETYYGFTPDEAAL